MMPEGPARRRSQRPPPSLTRGGLSAPRVATAPAAAPTRAGTTRAAEQAYARSIAAARSNARKGRSTSSDGRSSAEGRAELSPRRVSCATVAGRRQPQPCTAELVRSRELSGCVAPCWRAANDEPNSTGFYATRAGRPHWRTPRGRLPRRRHVLLYRAAIAAGQRGRPAAAEGSVHGLGIIVLEEPPGGPSESLRNLRDHFGIVVRIQVGPARLRT